MRLSERAALRFQVHRFLFWSSRSQIGVPILLPIMLFREEFDSVIVVRSPQ